MQQPAQALRRRLRYQAQDSAQTLAEALDEYYAANLDRVTRPADLPADSAALFRSHDICHVIFGLDTSLADETLADARTLFSCDVGMRRYARYLREDEQAKALFRQMGWARGVAITIACLPRILRAAVEAVRMRKPWPWTPPDDCAGRPLSELRRDYGIRVI
ncbi:MAG TPA: hypothetical protein VLI41_14540 [Phenylobacterium sp.]|uniref:hypothetical protein n=1 Tax=Phenylobacterium sp. TaxID=1871053 RepID=UPI002BC19E6B|nr:hypothetical protein [Phenylobacterium sp.]HSV04410.1 hypothetical protein [Phenylobacterium sp.]